MVAWHFIIPAAVSISGTLEHLSTSSSETSSWKDFRKADGKAGEDANRQFLSPDEGGDPEQFILPLFIQAIGEHSALMRVDDPVFLYSGVLINIIFIGQAYLGSTLGEDLNDPVWGSVAATLINFCRVADDAEVRLDYGVDLFITLFFRRKRKADIKGSGKYLALFAEQKGGNDPVEIAGYSLVGCSGGRRHLHDFSSNELYHLPELPGQVISIGIPFIKVELFNVCYHPRVLNKNTNFPEKSYHDDDRGSSSGMPISQPLMWNSWRW